MAETDHPSVRAMWGAYLATLGEDPSRTSLGFGAYHFCDRAEDADLCADLAAAGLKRATAGSLASYEAEGGGIPRAGDLSVVTDFAGVARCVVRTESVEVLAFAQVTAAHAAEEGEGDGSLEFWRRVHREFFERELAALGRTFTEDLPLAFERFRKVYPPEGSGAEVLATLRLMNRAWLGRAPEAMRPHLHPDVAMAFPNFAGSVSGREALLGGFEAFCRQCRVHSFTEWDHQVHTCAGSAVASYAFEMVYFREGPAFRVTGRDLWVFAREGGRWLAVWRTMPDMVEVPAREEDLREGGEDGEDARRDGRPT